MRLHQKLKRVEDTSKMPFVVKRPVVSGRVGESVEGEWEYVSSNGELEEARRGKVKVEKKIGFGQRRVFEDGELKRGFEPFAKRKETGEGKISGEDGGKRN